MDYQPGTTQIKENIEEKLRRHFGTAPSEATEEQIYKSAALTVKDILTEKREEYKKTVLKKGARQVYYLCMEFLPGRSLKNNLYNLNLGEKYKKAISELGFDIEKIYRCEPDAGLGNGGLGRLASCFLDALSSLDYPATGFSICYEYGLFRQKIIDGIQVEMPDIWLPGGEIWLVPRTDRIFEVRFGGKVREKWNSGKLETVYEGCDTVEAVPYDMMIPGADSDAVTRLRLWRARDIQHFNMNLFTQGQYARALEEGTKAGIISKVLYPSDNHVEGKMLRLAQQYFLVSASVQNIIRDHIAVYGTLENLPDKVAVHINDTHPALCIPEFMRILMDDYNFPWEKAWRFVTSIVSYTNHTVMPEALECWNEELFRLNLPRIYSVIREINERFCAEAWTAFPGNWKRIANMSVISYGQVHMANLSVIGSHSVNGVSSLHSDILKKNTFNNFYHLYPGKFDNVTNGIAHRRWLSCSNPLLASLIDECIGTEYRKKPLLLNDFLKFSDDGYVLERLDSIKKSNKVSFSEYIYNVSGQKIDADSVFDIQIKRVHEYKRQLLNALNIIDLYLELKENPNADIVPQTFIFGGKAAPGYYMAKQIIRLLFYIGREIEQDRSVRNKIRVIFTEDYNVSKAEMLIPAAEISEQISLAGKEASGTGCMKMMLNGAVTIGTLDGANIEILDRVGNENMYIFGLNSKEVDELWLRGYNSVDYYTNNERLKRIVNKLNTGFAGESFAEISSYLISGQRIADPYMCLADFESYRLSKKQMLKDYENRNKWTRMSLCNIANAGYFSADRSIEEYADRIWNLEKVRVSKDADKKTY